MASDSLSQVGKYIRRANRNADLALKRYKKKLPQKERARDTVSSVYPFTMRISTDGTQAVTLHINFNKPPPDDCTVDCISTACEGFQLLGGGHSLQVTNPYEQGTMHVYSNGAPLDGAQWYEESPESGQVYIQVQGSIATVVACYSFIVC